MLTESAGMRPVSEGIPRVVVVVTDGAATAGYEPACEVRKLSSGQGAAVLAVGVGRNATYFNSHAARSGLGGARWSFHAKSLAQMRKVAGSVASALCRAPAALACGGAVDVTVEEGSVAYLSVPGSLSAIELAATASSGDAMEVFANQAGGTSSTAQMPGPFNYDYRAAGVGGTKTLSVSGTANTRDGLVVGVHGAARGRTRVRVTAACSDAGIDASVKAAAAYGGGLTWNWNDGLTHPLLETAAPGAAVLSVPAPAYTCAAGARAASVFAIARGHGVPFAIDPRTGNITVTGPLDRETQPYYEFEVVVTPDVARGVLADHPGLAFRKSGLVRIDVVPAVCTSGTWSATGTHPCVAHTECATAADQVQVQVQAAPSATHDRVCNSTPGSLGQGPSGRGGGGDGEVAALALAVVLLAVVVALAAALALWWAKSRQAPGAAQPPAPHATEEPPLTVDELYADLSNTQRVAAFDFMYLGNPPLLQSPERERGLVEVFYHLQLPVPENLLDLLESTRLILGQAVPAGAAATAAAKGGGDEPALVDAVDFVARAIADVLLEDAIDALVAAAAVRGNTAPEYAVATGSGHTAAPSHPAVYSTAAQDDVRVPPVPDAQYCLANNATHAHPEYAEAAGAGEDYAVAHQGPPHGLRAADEDGVEYATADRRVSDDCMYETAAPRAWSGDAAYDVAAPGEGLAEGAATYDAAAAAGQQRPLGHAGAAAASTGAALAPLDKARSKSYDRALDTLPAEEQAAGPPTSTSMDMQVRRSTHSASSVASGQSGLAHFDEPPASPCTKGVLLATAESVQGAAAAAAADCAQEPRETTLQEGTMLTLRPSSNV